jgi:hypothetical protein
MLKIWNAIIIVLVFVSVVHADTGSIKFVKTLSSMDSPADVSRWEHREASKNCLTWKLDIDPVTKKKCVLFVTPTKDQVIYPGMNLRVNQGQPMDIKPYAQIVFEANSIGPNPAFIQLVLIDDANVARYGWWEVKPGWNTYHFDIPKAFGVRKLTQIQFGYDTPKENYKLYLSNVRLENNHFAASFDLLTDKIKASKVELSSELKKKYEGLDKELKSFKAATENSTITRWMDSVTQLDHDIYQDQVSKKVRQFESLNPNSTWGYAWADGITKVFRKDRVFDGTFGKIGEVSLAGNEYEGIQLVLRSKTKVSNVTVSVSDLTNSSGAKITSDNIQVLPVGYINTKQPPYEVDYVGWWPDPLLDFLKTFELDANVWQPVWLDIHAVAGQKPGTYHGTIRVMGDGVNALEIPLVVKVWDFSVPHEKHALTSINHFDGSEGVEIFKAQYAKGLDADYQKYYEYLWHKLDYDAIKDNPNCRRWLDLRRRQQQVIIEHRLDPLRLYCETPPFTQDVKMLKDAGFKTYCLLMIWSQRQLKKGDPYPAAKKKEYMEMLEEAVPRLKKAGLLEGAYVYGFDECEENEFAAIKDIFGEIKKRWPELKTMTTAYDYTYGLKTGLADVVDIWVPLTPKYDETREQIKQARQKGENVWWYVCMVPGPSYANILVEDSSIESRLLMGLMPIKYESQGFLYYSLNYWKTGEVHTPFAEHLNKGPLTNYDGKSWGDLNGDGLVFYPGDSGPVVTIRMKNMRDGLEDYEYLWLLQQGIDRVKSGELKAPEGWAARAEQARKSSLSLVTTMQEYTQSSDELLNARKNIGELLEQIHE